MQTTKLKLHGPSACPGEDLLNQVASRNTSPIAKAILEAWRFNFPIRKARPHELDNDI
jgi:hypothetical protein